MSTRASRSRSRATGGAVNRTASASPAARSRSRSRAGPPSRGKAATTAAAATDRTRSGKPLRTTNKKAATTPGKITKDDNAGQKDLQAEIDTLGGATLHDQPCPCMKCKKDATAGSSTSSVEGFATAFFIDTALRADKSDYNNPGNLLRKWAKTAVLGYILYMMCGPPPPPPSLSQVGRVVDKGWVARGMMVSWIPRSAGDS